MMTSSKHQGRSSSTIAGDPSPFAGNTARLSRGGQFTFGVRQGLLLLPPATSFIILFTLLFALNIPVGFASPNQSVEQRHMVTIEKRDQTFVQALESVAEQTGIEIVFHGAQPVVKRDVFIKYVDFDRAISQIMRIYDINNNASVYNADNESLVKVDIYGCSSSVEPTAVEPNSLSEEDQDGALTETQMKRLYAKNSQIPIDNDLSLTTDQIRLLREKEAVEKLREKEGDDPLTPEQIEMLNKKSNLSDIEDALAIEPLTNEQLDQLKIKNYEETLEIDLDPKPFTEGQLRLLHEKAEKENF